MTPRIITNSRPHDYLSGIQSDDPHWTHWLVRGAAIAAIAFAIGLAVLS